MTAIELIRALVRVDPDAEVAVEEYDGLGIVMTGIRKINNYKITIDIEITKEAQDDG